MIPLLKQKPIYEPFTELKQIKLFRAHLITILQSIGFDDELHLEKKKFTLKSTHEIAKEGNIKNKRKHTQKRVRKHQIFYHILIYVYIYVVFF